MMDLVLKVSCKAVIARSLVALIKRHISRAIMLGAGVYHTKILEFRLAVVHINQNKSMSIKLNCGIDMPSIGFGTW
jgi:hypothetical protein